MKKYIAYRYYKDFFNTYDKYERKELKESELTEYIKQHLGELKNIEIFSQDSKVKIEVNVKME